MIDGLKHSVGPAGRAACRVLFVDDDLDTRLVSARLLSARGFDVTTAGGVQDAMIVASQTAFNVVVADIGLPDGSGHELMSGLKSKYPLKGIAVSGYGMLGDKKASKEAGFDCHLTKPFTIEALHEAIVGLASAASASACSQA